MTGDVHFFVKPSRLALILFFLRQIGLERYSIDYQNCKFFTPTHYLEKNYRSAQSIANHTSKVFLKKGKDYIGLRQINRTGKASGKLASADNAMRKSSVWLIIFLLMSGTWGCSLFKKSSKNSGRINTSEAYPVPPPIIEVDQNFGVQYYLNEALVEQIPLPDSTLTNMVLLPGGEFIMGLNDEDPLGIQPAGNVRIAVSNFYLDQYEVTNKQYRAFLDALTPEDRQEMLPDSLAWAREIGVAWASYFWSEGYNDYPVVCVNHRQAQRFAEWAGKRLPTEAEWEYAARSGVSGRIYPWDGIYSRNNVTGEIMANFAPDGDMAADGFVITSPVGVFPPNNFRLYDIAGNVAEWTQDAYFPSYKVLKRGLNQLVTPSYVNPTETRKIVRGGSWASDEFFIGVGVRDYRFETATSPRVGFRCAMDNTNPLKRVLARRDILRRTQQMVNPNVVNYENPFAQEAAEKATQQQIAQGQAGQQNAAQGGAQQAQPEKKGFFQRIGDFFRGLFGGNKN